MINQRLLNRINTTAELSLMEMDVLEELEQIYKEFGKAETIRAIKKSGFYSVLKKQI